jgi:SNF2 family DNA or RNA helicase
VPERSGLTESPDDDVGTQPGVLAIDLVPGVESISLSALHHPLHIGILQAQLLNEAPWVRTLGKLTLAVSTEGWRFPVPPIERPIDSNVPAAQAVQRASRHGSRPSHSPQKKWTRLSPAKDTIVFKERLLYLLQPPLENLFPRGQVRVPLAPYSYQLEGIAFLMPRHGALLADEMGLGKTMQTILALRLLFQAGLLGSALLVCPKPLIHNWCRELRAWADDLPFEIIRGEADERRVTWLVSNCPVKLVNYEVLTRDACWATHEKVRFDVVVLDEAQRIKNRESKIAHAVRGIKRERSWALTGTPVENSPEDLINLFAFVDPECIPLNTSVKSLSSLTSDAILRRTKEDVLTDLPPKTVRDAYLELAPAQRAAYDLAESEGVVRLNSLGETINVRHVFELVMRLKQICNFEPVTGQSSKLEQLQADLAEVAESGRKAIIFSQWVGPIEYLALALRPFAPLQFHGRISPRERALALECFKNDPRRRVILMTYGTGSVGLNLQCANYVFLFDRWWNPAVEDQAISRAHRLGQRDPVFVTRFVTESTIEERIAEVLETKRQLFNDLIEQSGPPPLLGLSEEEIFGLFDIHARPKRHAA